MYNFWLSPKAELSIEDIYLCGYLKSGQRITEDYDKLIRQAFEDICKEPERPTSCSVPGKKDGLRYYSIIYSKNRANVKIKRLKYDILYFILHDRKIILIVDVLQSGREKAREMIEFEAILRWISKGPRNI